MEWEFAQSTYAPVLADVPAAAATAPLHAVAAQPVAVLAEEATAAAR